MSDPDNIIASEADVAVREALTGVIMRHLRPASDPNFVISSAWTGATFAVAHLAWRFKGSASLNEVADGQRAMTLSALNQVEAAENGGYQ